MFLSKIEELSSITLMLRKICFSNFVQTISPSQPVCCARRTGITSTFKSAKSFDELHIVLIKCLLKWKYKQGWDWVLFFFCTNFGKTFPYNTLVLFTWSAITYLVKQEWNSSVALCWVNQSEMRPLKVCVISFDKFKFFTIKQINFIVLYCPVQLLSFQLTSTS